MMRTIASLLFLFSASLFADDELPDVAGSLAFHTMELMEEAEGKEAVSIPFAVEDEIHLWGKIRALVPGDHSLEEAYEAFWLAKETSRENSFPLYRKAYRILMQCWDKSKREIPCGIELPIYSRSPDLPSSVLDEVEPYLISSSHPCKKMLDSLFTASRVTLNADTFTQAGFKWKKVQPRSFIIVARHPLLEGYVVKVSLDNELRRKKGKPEWQWFALRCEGAEKIAKIIKKKEIRHFVVAKKWIYPLPPEPAPPSTSEYSRKYVLLLAQDMNLVSKTENLNLWKTKITAGHLKELFKIISRANGSSYRADNIPFTTSGKIAFIDTEYPDRKPDYKSIRHFLSDEMRDYWDDLVRHKA